MIALSSCLRRWFQPTTLYLLFGACILILIAVALGAWAVVVLCRDAKERSVAGNIARLGGKVRWEHCTITEVCLKDMVVSHQTADLLSGLPNLTRLLVFLPKTRADDMALANIGKCRTLTYLAVSGWPPTDNEILNLKGPDGLVSLSLSGNKMSDRGLLHIGEFFPNLVEVRVYGSHVTAAGVAELKRLLPHVRVGWDEQGLPGDFE